MTSKLLTLAVALALSGCVSLEMGRLARDVEREVEATGTAEVGRGFAIAVGSGSIGTVRFVGRLSAPTATEPARRLAGSVRQVKLARYPITGPFDGRELSRPARLDRYEADGWLPLVTVRDTSEAVWVLYREDPDDLRLTDLLAVVVADEELMLTRVTGDLTALVLDAVAYGLENDALTEALDEAGLVWDDDAADAPDVPATDEAEVGA